MSTTIILELGDIIEIISPNKDEYHEKVFIIDYIDNDQITIIQVNNGNKYELKMENNVYVDEIEQINLLDRNEKKGFIAQNNLQVNIWIDIHFGGQYPKSFTGRISNIENDMMEITIYPEVEVIFIDFKYQGIPKEIPIKHIEVIEPPLQIKENYMQEIKEQENIPEGEPIDTDINISAQEEDMEVEQKLENELETLYNETNEIIFGEKLETLREAVELPEQERRYNIEIQINDFMDQLLSTIPNSQRSSTVMNNINLLVTRFKELRENFSVFENDYIILKPKEKGPFYKPLVNNLKELNQKLKWLIPVISQRKKIFNDDEYDGEDVINIDIQQEINRLENTKTFDEKSRYIDEYTRPYIEPYNNNEILHIKNVNTNIEGIVDNLMDFNSTTKQYGEYKNKRFVIENYNLSHKSFPSDKIHIKSFITLPKRMMEFSKLYLPNSNIAERVDQYNNFYGNYRFLHKYSDIIENTIESIETELDYKDIDLLNKLNHFTISNDINMEQEDKYNRFLESFIPQTKTIINIMRKQMKNKYSFSSFVKQLEPYLIYENDITYTQYNDIRFTIKENIQTYKKNLQSRSGMFGIILNEKYFTNNKTNKIIDLIKEEDQKHNNVSKVYKIKKDSFDSEILKTMTNIDCGKMFYSILAKQMFNLNVPLKMDSILDKSDSKIRVKNTCNRRFLSKDYTSLEELLSDNNKEEIFYDSKYDDTPYGILDEYASEKKNMTIDNFIEFITEILLEKHEAHSSYANIMARTMVKGKKKIENGDFARLVLEDEDTIHFYKYNKQNWVRDNTISEEMFMSDNELFCNIQAKCLKNTVNNSCENLSMVASKLHENRLDILKNEMNDRIDVDLTELEKTIDENIQEYRKYLHKYSILQEIQEQKQNNLAYEIGLYASSPTAIKSPYFDLFQKILGNKDYSDKQQQIVKFVNLFCREPIENSEHQHWKYCKDTNVRLVPSFLFKLAEAFTLNTDFTNTLMRIIREQGVLSDDGEAIIDRYSGMVIRNIDFSSEEGFDASGYSISSREILEEDLMLMKKRQANLILKTFENPTMELIYVVFHYLCKIMDIRQEQIQDYALKLSNDLVNTQIMSRTAYEKRSQKLKDDTNKELAPYEQYYNETLILIVSSVLLISIQTVIPNIVTRKTFPGCVNSFDGYPYTGEEDISGIEYIACVLYKTKSNIEPWNSVYKFSQATFSRRIKTIIEKNIITRNDVSEKYKTKKLYLQIQNNNDEKIPHNVQNWLQFQPPLNKLKLNDPVNFSKEFKNSFIEEIKRGGLKQREMYDIVLGKLRHYNIALFDAVNKIVRNQTPILKTHGLIPFTDNACCNSENSPIEYFSSKDNNINIYLKNIQQNIDFIADIKKLSKATMLFHNSNTRILYPELPKGQLEENVYAAFIHYCNYDKDIPVPQAYTNMCGEKPKDYDKNMSLEEKVVFLKRNGKNYNMNNLLELMNIVNNENKVLIDYGKHEDIIENMNVFLEELEIKNSNVIEEPLIRLLKKVLNKFDLNKKYSEDYSELETLKDYLIMTNNKMYLGIMDFIERSGSLSNDKYDLINDFLINISKWKETTDNKHYNMTSFFKNSIHKITNIIPNIIINNPTHHYGPRGTKSFFSKQHLKDLDKILKEQFTEFYKYNENEYLKRVITLLEPSYNDLLRFMLNIPYMNESTEFTLFDYKTQELLLTYIFYSLFYEMIEISNVNELTDYNIELRKKEIARLNEENNDNNISADYTKLNENESQQYNDIQEIEINLGNFEESKKTLANLMISTLQVNLLEKSLTDHSYTTIINKTKKAKDYEKRQIIKYLGNMSIEDRKIEELHKKYKMGRWDVGDYVNYNKDVYDKERDDAIKQLINEPIEGNEVVTEMVQNIIDLETAEKEQQDEFYEKENFDISGLGSNFHDGNFDEEHQEFD